jgi:hypothetical protein
VLLGLGGLVSLDSLLYDAESRVFRRLDWLRNSARRFPCCGISSILGCWPSRFSSPCQRRGGEGEGRGAGLLKIIVAAGIADSAFSPEGESRAVKCRLPRDLTTSRVAERSGRVASGLQVPSWDGDVARQRVHRGRDSVLHWPGPQREGPFCARPV